MLPEIAAAATSLNVAKELIKTALGVVKDAAARDAIIKIQTEFLAINNSLLQAQISQQELINTKKELEQKLIDYEKWDADAPNYELLEVSLGVRVYSEKSQKQGIYERVWHCPNCFENKQKRILQLKSRTMPWEYVCHHCKSSFMVRPRQES